MTHRESRVTTQTPNATPITGEAIRKEVVEIGLDSYLYASKYVSGYAYQRASQVPELQQGVSQFDAVLNAVGIPLASIAPDSPHLTVEVAVGYWRKANAIHAWFVQHCQDGVDDCRRTYVTAEQLTELRDTCQEVIDSVEWGGTIHHPAQTEPWRQDAWDERQVIAIPKSDLLEPTSGFFFGSTNLDEWYVKDLESTVAIIDRVLADPALKDADLYYHSSW